MGPIFHKKIPNYGSDAKNGYLFLKILKQGNLFFGKITPEHGYGPPTTSGTSPTNPNLRTTSGGQATLVWIHSVMVLEVSGQECFLSELVYRSHFETGWYAPTINWCDLL